MKELGRYPAKDYHGLFLVMPTVALREATALALMASFLNRGKIEDLAKSHLTSVKLPASLSH